MQTAKTLFQSGQLMEDSFSLDPVKEDEDYVLTEESHEDQEGLVEKSDTSLTKSEHRVKRPIYLYPRSIPKQKFKLLQKWEGTVLNISEEDCLAVIRDLIRPENPEEEITFSLEEIPGKDRELAVPGGVFTWSIGYFDDKSGVRHRTSTIMFRRLPYWRKKDLEKAQEQAKSLRERLGWEQIQTTSLE